MRHAAWAECRHVFINVQSHNPACACCYVSTSGNRNKVCLLNSPVLDQIDLPKFVHIHNSIFSTYSSQLYLMILPRFYVWGHWWSCLPKCSISPPWCWLASSPSILHADWLSRGHSIEACRLYVEYINCAERESGHFDLIFRL